MKRRFSLWSLLVTLTLLALGITCLVLNLRLRRLDGHLAEVSAKSRRLEAQLGIVAPGDPTKVQVLQVAQLDRYHWKWRLRLPVNSTYTVSFRCGPVGLQEFQDRDGTFSLSRLPTDDEITEIELQLSREGEGPWRRLIRINGRRITGELSESMQAWLTNGDSFVSESAGAGGTQEFPDYEPIVLLRGRDLPPRDPKNQLREIPTPPYLGPTEHGLRLWLEVEPAK